MAMKRKCKFIQDTEQPHSTAADRKKTPALLLRKEQEQWEKCVQRGSILREIRDSFSYSNKFFENLNTVVCDLILLVLLPPSHKANTSPPPALRTSLLERSSKPPPLV